MEDQEKYNERVRKNIDELKGGVRKIMQMLQALTAKEVQSGGLLSLKSLALLWTLSLPCNTPVLDLSKLLDLLLVYYLIIKYI